MKPNGRRRWRKWAKKNGAGRGDFADYRRFRRHGDSTYDGVVGMRPGPCPRRPFTLRSLVGMTMGARKRAAWDLAATNHQHRDYSDPDQLFNPEVDATQARQWAKNLSVARAKYRIGERVRPCLGCEECRGYDDGIGVIHCDGSGVLPANR